MNQVQSDALDEVLVARAAMYGLLQRVFSDVPDRALAENESCEVMDQCFEVLGEAWAFGIAVLARLAKAPARRRPMRRRLPWRGSTTACS